MDHYGHTNATMPEFVAWVNFSTSEEPLSYVWQQKHRSILILHILLMLTGTLIVLPAALLLRTSRYRGVIWSLSSTILLLGAGAAAFHRANTEDLYKNALHRKMGFLVIAIVLISAAWTITTQIFETKKAIDDCGFSAIPQSEEIEIPRLSNEAKLESSEDDSARSSETLFRRQQHPSPERDSFDELLSRNSRPGESKKPAPATTTFRDWLASTAPTALLTLVYAQILMGIATYCGLFTNHEIFNGLAHWIKSSVFFLFGIWVFIRYLGGFSAIGHAWNDTSSTALSAECIECSLIFTYGVIDLFLERLGHSSEPISHTDIQHMSIAAMFAFAGFVGLLFESRRMQALFSSAIGNYAGAEEKRQMSLNVMPSLVVFFTGMLMSVHKQDTQFASDVHAVWGYYFCTASVLRVLTYMLVYVTSSRSARNTKPARPPTEPLVAFCLIAGSIAFSFSARDSVQVFEYYGIDLMFIISLTVAGSLGVLVWVMYAMVLNGLEKHKYLR